MVGRGRVRACLSDLGPGLVHVDQILPARRSRLADNRFEQVGQLCEVKTVGKAARECWTEG